MNAADPTRFRAAADILRTGGWCRDVYEKNGQHCVVGALLEVVDTLTTAEVAAEVLTLALLITGGEPEDLNKDTWLPGWDEVTKWNDDPDRTIDDVLNLLERAGGITRGAQILVNLLQQDA